MNIHLVELAITHFVASIPEDIGTTGAGAPPGSTGLIKVLAWGLWIAFGVCVLGIVKAGGGLALVGIGHGGGQNHGVGFVMAIVGTVIVGSAAAIATAVT